MPELPEVETVKNGLIPAMDGRRIECVTLNRLNLRYPFDPDFTNRLQGRKIQALSRRGKYIIANMKDLYLIIHLGMSGSFRINDPGGSRHDHVILNMEGGVQIIYSDPRRFGFMQLTEDLKLYRPFALMGPEPLDPNLTADHFQARLAGKSISIKAALLDQSVIAGIGNIYACEALYRAEINPWRPAASLTGAEVTALLAGIRDILCRAIAVGGSSLRDHRQADGKMGYFQHEFAVYNQAGEVCNACLPHMTRIEREQQNGRSTFFCERCQR